MHDRARRAAVTGPMRLFLALLDRCLADASVAFRHGADVTAAGRPDLAPAVVVDVRDVRVFQRVLALGNLGLGEAYMDGDFVVEQGSLADLLTILLRNRLDVRLRSHPRLALRVLALRARNRLRRFHANVRQHYDQGEDLFESFLDRTMTYSCGYAKTPHDTSEELQQNKFERICRKLRLAPGQRLLDIGCGFGGLVIHAARTHGVSAVGITNSRAHAARGRANAERAGVADRVDIRLGDFSTVAEPFDRIASVGMLEHVPHRLHARYFQSIAGCLAPRGFGLVHAIGCTAPSNDHDPFIQTYVFPGSNQPRLSEIAGGLERHRLPILDVENLVRHYGYTVSRWLERFQENAGRLDGVKYNARFRRMWEYYLSCGIAAAAVSEAAVYQVLFTNDPTIDLPLARV